MSSLRGSITSSKRRKSWPPPWSVVWGVSPSRSLLLPSGSSRSEGKGVRAWPYVGKIPFARTRASSTVFLLYKPLQNLPQADQSERPLQLDDMNPLMLLPLLASACIAAPSVAIHAAAVPYAVQHEVTAHVPSGVELKQVGDVLPVAHPVAPVAVPGYAVQGELRQVTHEFPEPSAVAVDVNALPVLGATAVAAPVAYAAAAPAVVGGAAVVAPAVAPAVVAPAVAPALAYSNVNLNIPAPVPAGEAPAPEELVQRIPVKALGRPVVSYTPQITEVRPELKVYERTYDVSVPKPVYETKEVTPVHHQYVPEPYAVPHPVAVPQPVAVPTPVNVPYAVPQPVHVQHNVIAPPAVAAVGYHAAAAVPAAAAVGYHAAVAAPAALGYHHAAVAAPAALGYHHAAVAAPAALGYHHAAAPVAAVVKA
ncbi:calphotin-like [Macrobrachium rosenbergii]|uniref:calphotin-like n=1 Tax=Macrobrachium rosenbergii TaxID=79674 RepID=UPI0034D40BD1